jgi:hypothetical protein
VEAVDKDCLKQLDNLLAAGDQSWLFGAGVGVESNVPAMGPLTTRVLARAVADSNKVCGDVLGAAKSELPDDSHIEHILSHLVDFAAIADRSKTQKAQVGGKQFKLDDLRAVHEQVLRWIAETIRWGFVPKAGAKEEQVGSYDKPIVKVALHSDFVSALFNRSQAGVEDRRRAVRLFTTNYDTLFEDALALGCITYWDGFSGGALAFRSHRFGQAEPDSDYRALLVKMHGSIDWQLGADDRVWRVRDNDLYPERRAPVLIFPQFTKYLATQRDPFAAQFDLFRRALGANGENVLVICGYGFGDEHVNKEIEIALERPDNKTTILAFSRDLNEVLGRWQRSRWAKRLYVMTESGLFVGAEGPHFAPPEGKQLDWWKFSGVTRILNNGAEACTL